MLRHIHYSGCCGFLNLTTAAALENTEFLTEEISVAHLDQTADVSIVHIDQVDWVLISLQQVAFIFDQLLDVGSVGVVALWVLYLEDGFAFGSIHDEDTCLVPNGDHEFSVTYRANLSYVFATEENIVIEVQFLLNYSPKKETITAPKN